MKTSELRIGNYLKKDDKVLKISGATKWVVFLEHGFQVFVPEMFVAGGVAPIPLTEDWLPRFGFKVDEDKGFDCALDTYHKVYSLNEFNVAIINDKFRLWIEVEEDKYYSFAWTVIEYVHQLQNLFYALKREELELK